jgi:hypothetical protein
MVKNAFLTKSPSYIFISWLIVLTFIPFIIIFSLGFLSQNAEGGISFIPTLQNYIR